MVGRLERGDKGLMGETLAFLDIVAPTWDESAGINILFCGDLQALLAELKVAVVLTLALTLDPASVTGSPSLKVFNTVLSLPSHVNDAFVLVLSLSLNLGPEWNV